VKTTTETAKQDGIVQLVSMRLSQAKGWQTWRLLAEVGQQGWVQGA